MSTLDREFTDRSYCFGRVAAVYEIAERNTFSPNYFPEPLACRMQEGYLIQHPAQALVKLENNMCDGIWEKLDPESREFFRQEIAEILGKMDATEETYAKPLDHYFVMGYFHERSWLREHNKIKWGVKDAE